MRLKILLLILVLVIMFCFRFSRFYNKEEFENIYIPSEKAIEEEGLIYLKDTYMIVNEKGIFFTTLGMKNDWNDITGEWGYHLHIRTDKEGS